VPASFRRAVLTAFIERRGMPIDAALDAARERITEACAQ
jgi:hypothetical protein